MKIYMILFVMLVGFFNVMMHIFIGKASKANLQMVESIWSPNFFLALLSGFLSVFAILFIYHSKMNITQGIIIMGASSIIIGTFLGILFMGNKLNFYDWLLFALMIIFYALKLIKGNAL